jgi:hypothetical protein
MPEDEELANHADGRPSDHQLIKKVLKPISIADIK